ncbi:MAG: HAD-IA family hydrolase [Erysipelotrichaceae bacterium]|nr:HAD-IA family hydrolase [Erysipelotrichaceae bacterium]
MNTMIKSIIFDANGVIQGINRNEVVFGANRLRLHQVRYFIMAITSEAHRIANKGIYKTKEETIQALAREFPGKERQLREVYSGNWESFFKLYPKVRKLLEELSSDYDLYLLSNMSFPEKEHFISEPVYPMFNGTLFSCDAGLLKPDESIYRLLLNKYKLKPEETMFFDDSARNVEAARALGIHAARVRAYAPDVRKMREEIKKAR